MNKYNYYEAVKSDILNALTESDYEEILKSFDTPAEAYDEIYDALFVDDSVTGNASGSYWCNRWDAEECLCHNFDLIEETAFEFGYTPKVSTDYEKGAEWWDVSIRCHVLSEVLYDILCNYYQSY